MKNKDIDEISSHIKKLKKINSVNRKSKKSPSKRRKNKKTKSKAINKSNKIEENNTEILSSLQIQEPVSIMNPEVIGFTDDSTVTCDVCNHEIVLGKNLSGLVVADEFFACEKCCQEIPKKKLMDWTKSKMVSGSDVRPIGLWVIQQQDSNKKEK